MIIALQTAEVAAGEAMLESVFRSRRVRMRLEAGVLGPMVSALAARLQERSRSAQVVRKYVRAVGHFSHWLGAEGLGPTAWDAATVARFVEEHGPVCRCPVPVGEPLALTRSALGHVLALQGRPPGLRHSSTASEDEVTAGFRNYLRDVCGMAASSCVHYCRTAQAFLAASFGEGPGDLTRLTPREVTGFVSDCAARVSPGTARQRATELRAFLRWLQFRGICDARLVAAVPRIPYWKLASIPKLLTDDQVRLLLSAFDRSKDAGRRDYAIALCLVRLGLRSNEVAQLRLDDIDWRGGTLRIGAGKRRRPHVLPLPPDVARAIVSYLKRGRPRVSERSVFLRRALPHRPMRSTNIQALIRAAHQRGGVGSPWRGTHVLRHTVASRLLRNGASLKEIADILGHRSIDTTAIYAKVDLPRLARVALPWPGRKP